MTATPPRVPRFAAGRVVRTALLVLATTLAVAVAVFLAWALTPLGPTPQALKAATSDSAVTVTQEDWGLLFSPAVEATGVTTGLLLYPGGRVDHRSYATLAREIARRGYRVGIMRVPLSLAVFKPRAAAGAMEALPSVDRWVVGGHSLGGVMASSYAASDDRVSGLLLLASYPTEDLSGQDLEVEDVSASLDGVLDTDAWRRSQDLLPPATGHTVIEGGNHAQFGDYGPQPGDNTAQITAAEQRNRTASVAVQLLARVAAP